VTKAFLVAAAISLAAAPAYAAKAKKSDAPRKEKKTETTPAPKPPDTSLDFDLLGDATPKVSAAEAARQLEIENQVKLRRGMLLWHQALGIATWVGLGATEVVGQLELSDKYGGGGDSGRYLVPHEALALTTAALFAAVGTLGLLAPTPYKRPFKLDTTTLHKIAMSVATAGMLAQVALGFLAASREGQLDQRTFAAAHQISGYVTLGAMSVGAVVLVF